MAWIPLALMAVSMVMGSQKSDQDAQNAAAAQEAASKQEQLQVNENEREAGEVDASAAQQMGDRARQADAQQATMRVMMGERGMASNAQSRSIMDAGYVEGQDLSRIEYNRQARIGALVASSNAAVLGENFAIQTSNNQLESAEANNFMSSVGSGLQIGGKMYQNQTYNDILSGKTNNTGALGTSFGGSAPNDAGSDAGGGGVSDAFA